MGPSARGAAPGWSSSSSSVATGGSATRSSRPPRDVMTAHSPALTDTALSQEFPVLDREGLVYLDSSATSQKPRVVIDAIADYYAHHNANIPRGVYPLAVEATDLYEGGRERAAAWLSSTPQETIFTKNATEAINLVAYAWGRRNVGAGDAVVLTQMEHHSNIVPWQLLCQEVGAEIRYLEVDDQGRLSLDQLDACLADGRGRLR